MLQLVVNNAFIAKTCASHCKLYDKASHACAIWKNIDGEDAKYFDSCKDRVPYVSSKGSCNDESITSTSMIDSFSGLEYQSENQTLAKDLGYPVTPDYTPSFEHLNWYVSPEQSFGCWLYYENQRSRLILIESMQENSEINSRQYASPIPLHDHKTSAHLASNIVWYVQSNGVGNYRFIVDDEIFNL